MSTTTTLEVPREEWVSFFNDFSRRHDRWLVNIELIGGDLGAQVAGRSLRFEGVNADLKDGEDLVTIDLGHEADRAYSHTISHPTHVWLGRSVAESGQFETLDIESAGGVTTLVRFLAGVVPND